MNMETRRNQQKRLKTGRGREETERATWSQGERLLRETK